MRGRKLVKVIVLAGFMVGMAALFVWWATRPRAIDIGVIGYEPWDKGPCYWVRLGITNISHTPLLENEINFNSGWLQTETPSGWSKRSIGPEPTAPSVRFVTYPFQAPPQSLPPNLRFGSGIGLGSHYNGLLAPASSTEAFVLIPADTKRWQVGYKVRTISLRERVFSRIPVRWQPRLAPLCKFFLSDKEGPMREFRSRVFEVPPMFCTPLEVLEPLPLENMESE